MPVEKFEVAYFVVFVAKILSLCFGLLFWFGVWIGCRPRHKTSTAVNKRHITSAKVN
jgi:hypothetical protein